MASPRSRIQSRMARVPSWASPSSSPVMVIRMAPSGGASSTKPTAAATNAATPDFISVAPRPKIQPSFTSAEKGSTLQSAISPGGHDIGVAVEPEGPGRPSFAPAGYEVRNPAPVGTEAGETSRAQVAVKQCNGAPLFRGHRSAADQLAGQVDGINGHAPLANACRKNLQSPLWHQKHPFAPDFLPALPRKHPERHGFAKETRGRASEADQEKTPDVSCTSGNVATGFAAGSASFFLG